jgi:hypothetical protein
MLGSFPSAFDLENQRWGDEKSKAKRLTVGADKTLSSNRFLPTGASKGHRRHPVRNPRHYVLLASSCPVSRVDVEQPHHVGRVLGDGGRDSTDFDGIVMNATSWLCLDDIGSSGRGRRRVREVSRSVGSGPVELGQFWRRCLRGRVCAVAWGVVGGGERGRGASTSKGESSTEVLDRLAAYVAT